MDMYIGPSRQLKRYDSATKSPIYSHLSESFAGVSTIRSYDKVEDFKKSFRLKIDNNNRAFWYYLQGNRWLNFSLNALASSILLIVSVQSVIQKESTSGGDAGLLISYALNLTQYLSLVIRLSTMFETNAVSIERINEYCENVEEDVWEKSFRPDSNWPQKGEIEFKDYSTKYRESTNLVLKNLNFKIDSTEKIGIVGR